MVQEVPIFDINLIVLICILWRVRIRAVDTPQLIVVRYM